MEVEEEGQAEQSTSSEEDSSNSQLPILLVGIFLAIGALVAGIRLLSHAPVAIAGLFTMLWFCVTAYRSRNELEDWPYTTGFLTTYLLSIAGWAFVFVGATVELNFAMETPFTDISRVLLAIVGIDRVTDLPNQYMGAILLAISVGYVKISYYVSMLYWNTYKFLIENLRQLRTR